MIAVSSPLTRRRTTTLSAIDTSLLSGSRIPALSGPARKLNLDQPRSRPQRGLDHRRARAFLGRHFGAKPAEDRKAELTLEIPLAELDRHHDLGRDPADPVIHPSWIVRGAASGQAIQRFAQGRGGGIVEAAHHPTGWVEGSPIVGRHDQRLEQAVTGLRNEADDDKILVANGLDQQPIRVTLARPVRTVEPFGDHAFKALLFRSVEKSQAIIGDRLHHIDPRRTPEQIVQAAPTAYDRP